jgi:hypothetical protein
MTKPFASLALSGPSPKLFYIVLALWFTLITVSCFAAGGYVTGRMRRPIDGSTTHEVHVRDGATGSWFGPLWWSLSLSSAVKGGADLAKSCAARASSVVEAPPRAGSLAHFVSGRGQWFFEQRRSRLPGARRCGAHRSCADRCRKAGRRDFRTDEGKAREATETARKAGIFRQPPRWFWASRGLVGAGSSGANGDFAQNDGKSDMTP